MDNYIELQKDLSFKGYGGKDIELEAGNMGILLNDENAPSFFEHLPKEEIKFFLDLLESAVEGGKYPAIVEGELCSLERDDFLPFRDPIPVEVFSF